MATLDPVELLRRLAGGRVELVVVGMAAGVLRGAPVATADVDVVHSRHPDNVSRLLAVLGALDATYRHDPRHLRPTESHLASPGHHLLSTIYGSLDCLGTVGDAESYEDLLPNAPEMELGEGLTVRVVDLPTLIRLKEHAGRPKDLAVLPVLRATLAETQRRS
jgi:hypothetical protein